MGIGRTIRIYLDDGSISGIKHAEIVNWTGQAISVPRTQIKHLSDWNESKRPGVYFLFGVDENTGGDAVYIGESENVFDRLQQHLASKDFWNEAVFFTSKDENLTKSHVKYLESRIVELAKTADRYYLLNGNKPQQSILPRGDRDAMEEFIANIKVLLGAIGHKTLEQLSTHENQNIESTCFNPPATVEKFNELFLKVKGIDARAIITNEGIVVLAGSTLSETAKDSLSVGYKKYRQQLLDTGVICQTGSSLLFSKDQLFKSPSQSAAIIAGYAINGRHYWQDINGMSLKEMEEKI